MQQLTAWLTQQLAARLPPPAHTTSTKLDLKNFLHFRKFEMLCDPPPPTSHSATQCPWAFSFKTEYARQMSHRIQCNRSYSNEILLFLSSRGLFKTYSRVVAKTFASETVACTSELSPWLVKRNVSLFQSLLNNQQNKSFIKKFRSVKRRKLSCCLVSDALQGIFH